MSDGARFWCMVALLLVATVSLRMISHGEAVPLEKSLAAFPLSFGAWKGRDLPMEPRILKAVGVDDYLSRLYEAPGNGPLFVYVGYYKSQRTGRLIHSPKNCLPGAGWEPVTARRVLLAFPNGTSAPVNLYVIEKGLERQVVLYWYESHGRIIASEYWGKIYMVTDALRLNRTDAALVRVSAPFDGDERRAQTRVIAFAEQLSIQLKSALPQ